LFPNSRPFVQSWTTLPRSPFGANVPLADYTLGWIIREKFNFRMADDPETIGVHFDDWRVI
jgi:hypothetical protein